MSRAPIDVLQAVGHFTYAPTRHGTHQCMPRPPPSTTTTPTFSKCHGRLVFALHEALCSLRDEVLGTVELRVPAVTQQSSSVQEIMVDSKPSKVQKIRLNRSWKNNDEEDDDLYVEIKWNLEHESQSPSQVP
ncbi:hypothetical protein BJ912DRAFT_1062845 [Pholiota molesta]|nr:hypothetical protein BJ912DRAFT_1062845 [Pholiota molesta]